MQKKLKMSYLTENILLKFIFCSSSALICRSQQERKPIVCSKCQCTTNKPGFPPHLEFPIRNKNPTIHTQTQKTSPNTTKIPTNTTKCQCNNQQTWFPTSLGISNWKSTYWQIHSKENLTKYDQNTKKYITLGKSNSKVLTNTLKIPKINKIPSNTNRLPKNTQISVHQQQTWCPNSLRISNSQPKC